MQHWLAKSEPATYSWDDLQRDGKTAWTGVRNFQARNNLRAMKAGDRVLFYHSGETKEIVAVAKVVKAAYPDPTAKEGDWVCVDLAPVKALARPVTLATVKAAKQLKTMVLVQNSRLSVQPVTGEQFNRVLGLGGTKLRDSFCATLLRDQQGVPPNEPQGRARHSVRAASHLTNAARTE